MFLGGYTSSVLNATPYPAVVIPPVDPAAVQLFPSELFAMSPPSPTATQSP